MAKDYDIAEFEKPVDKMEKGEDEEEDRGQWTGRLDFILSCLSFAVGIGNVWRFPYMCFKNGGAVFLIPYLLMLVLVGLPAFYMELCLGQFSGKGPVDIWAAVPIMRGIGYTMLMNSFVQSIYYTLLVAWSLYYLFASFAAELPWSRCMQGISTWSTERCYSNADHAHCQDINSNYTYYQGACRMITNTTMHKVSSNLTNSSPSEEYFDNAVLHLSHGDYSMDYISWKLALSLLAAWVIIFFCMIKGSKSFGKVVYVTATFPYLVLTILLIRGATLPGSDKGVMFYIIPDFSRLADPVVWFDAASQIFYSLGCGMGTLATFGSFNEFKKKNKGDAYVVALGNSFTSIYAGFAIFCILGFMAADAGVRVQDVAADGSGLAFIAYPQAVSRMPVSQLWSVLFFVMLLALGTGSLFGPVEVVMTTIQDNWPRLRRYRVFLLAGLIIFMYIIGLTLTTNIGVYILTVCNDYNAYAIVLVSIIELLTVAYIYGVKRFVADVELMLDTKLGVYWKIAWGFTAPFLTLGVVVYSFILHEPSVYGKKPLPQWMNFVGWGIVVISIIPIPIVMVQEILKNKDSSKGWRALFRSNENWFPASKEFKQAYLEKYAHSYGVENGQVEMTVQSKDNTTDS